MTNHIDHDSRDHRRRKQIVDELRTYPTFAACSADDLDELVGAAADFSLPARWSLLQEGIPADAFYIIREGTARVYDGRDAVASVGPGDVVGEMAFVGGGQRRATVSSVTRLTGIRVDYAALSDIIARRPRLNAAIHAVYESRVA